MNVVSRTKQFGRHAILFAFGLTFTASDAPAQIGWAPDGEVCTAERTVSGVVVEKKTCVRWKPVTQVCMKREESVTYRDECRTGYRPEQYVQCVPRTTYDQVTVDEGQWKMVWCPNPVTKVVPRTTMEQQVQTRQVPFTYNVKVPQVVARMVPHYSTKYVPETYQTVERKPFHHRLPGQQTVMRPPSCSSPAPTCSAPVSMPMTTYAPPAAPPVTTMAPPIAAPAAPTCAMPQTTSFGPSCALPTQTAMLPHPAPPGCAVPGGSSVYPPAAYEPTYSEAAPVPEPYHPSHHDDGHGHAHPHDHGPTPADAAPAPMADPQSYYPTQSPAGGDSWKSANSTPEQGSTTDKSLAALWQK